MGPLRMTSALGQYSIPIDQYLGSMPNKSNGLATPQALLAVNQTRDLIATRLANVAAMALQQRR